jgi:hypothetical protein
MSQMGRCIANAATHRRILLGMSLALAVALPRPGTGSAQTLQLRSPHNSSSPLRTVPGQAPLRRQLDHPFSDN